MCYNYNKLKVEWVFKKSRFKQHVFCFMNFLWNIGQTCIPSHTHEHELQNHTIKVIFSTYKRLIFLGVKVIGFYILHSYFSFKLSIIQEKNSSLLFETKTLLVSSWLLLFQKQSRIFLNALFCLSVAVYWKVSLPVFVSSPRCVFLENKIKFMQHSFDI